MKNLRLLFDRDSTGEQDADHALAALRRPRLE